MPLNRDFRDLFAALSAERVRYLLVIGRDDLAKNKRASGRDQDLVDLKKLLGPG